MFPKGIQFANKPWIYAVETLQQIRSHHPTVISLSDVHDVQGLAKLWKSFIIDVKVTMIQPSTTYKLMHEFLDTHFVKADIDFYTCLSSLLSANLFKRYNELDTFTLGLLISVIKEKCDHMVVRQVFPHFYGPVLSLKLTISEDDDHIVAQMELINQLEQLTNFWLAYLSSEFPEDVSKFDPVHFLFDWIRLAYCLIISGIIGGKTNYFNVGVKFLFVIKSKNLQQYTNFTKYIIDELWDSLRSIYYRAGDLSSNASLSGNEHSSNSDQNPTGQDLIDSYYQEFSLLLKLCRLTSNLNCSTCHKIDNRTLDKLTYLIFDRLATLCFYQCGITIHNHPSVYHAIFGVCNCYFVILPICISVNFEFSKYVFLHSPASHTLYVGK
ncbi:hypothetical protein MN116_005860 [Schistosoma mekongi]|uniref:Uncharacterized protein n=1 Tax=Schistosoma mekongi TaxID=38744 RepID=A0AAE2D3Y2_SCHME|nr:hypothetical protein MN116_005860 [Schistosoma mekongi]